jgi:hypothetical protein
MVARVSLEQLLSELVPAWTEVERIARADTDAWVVLLRGLPAIGVIDEPEHGRIVATARLGRGAEEHRMVVYQAMLNCNALAPETGGLRIGLTGTKLDIEIAAVLKSDGLGAGDFRFILGHVAAVAKQWQAFVADPGAGSPSAALDYGRTPGAIRG